MIKSLKIKNFGPINDGFENNDGFIPFAKVTLFCGPQGAGKSSVAKLFSIFSWLEKALKRGDFNEKYLTSFNRFVSNYCVYQNIQNYFRTDTFIHYKGNAYEMVYEKSIFSVKDLKSEDYIRPQIIYIPAERNILSVLEDAENVKGLPPALNTLMDAFVAACKNIKGYIKLPVNDLHFSYDKLNKIPKIESDGYSVRLSETSSGMQSVTPMCIVLDYLTRNLGAENVQKSLKEREEIRRRIDELLNDDSLDSQTRKILIDKVADSSNKYLLSIVEEPEQNLYPETQRNILNFLLAVNSLQPNQLVMTTHSPYIVNYLSLAVKAQKILSKMPQEKIAELDKIVPSSSVIDGGNVNVFELTSDGRIVELPKYDDMPSDNNLLNGHLVECNDLFGQLLELEDSL